MNHPLRCACGTVRGHVVLPVLAVHATCYCKDCRAFARFLGKAPEVLDEFGGTRVIATLPSHVRFDAGQSSIACMSLSGKGLLRWYARCCATPIGNTPPDRKMHYVGLVHNALAEPLDPVFGPPRMKVNTAVTDGKVKATPVIATLSVLKLMRGMVPARLGSGWLDNPFFDRATGRPIADRRVLTDEERSALRG